MCFPSFKCDNLGLFAIFDQDHLNFIMTSDVFDHADGLDSQDAAASSVTSPDVCGKCWRMLDQIFRIHKHDLQYTNIVVNVFEMILYLFVLFSWIASSSRKEIHRSILQLSEIVMHPEQSYGAFKEAPGAGGFTFPMRFHHVPLFLVMNIHFNLCLLMVNG